MYRYNWLETLTRMTMKKRFLKYFAIALTLVALSFLFVVHYATNTIIKFQTNTHEIDRTRINELGLSQFLEVETDKLKRPWGTMVFDYQVGSNPCAIIFLHGHSSTRLSGQRYASLVENLNCTRVFPDLAYHGESTAKYAGYGSYEYADVIAISEWIEEKFQIPSSKQGIIGESMGAAIGVLAASKHKKPFSFLWLDSPYADLSEMIAVRGAKMFGPVLAKILVPSALLMAEWRGDLKFSEIAPIAALESIPTSTAIGVSHSVLDAFTPISQSKKLVEKLDNRPHSFWWVENLPYHARAVDRRSEGYKKAFDTFMANKTDFYSDLRTAKKR